ncbi:hypothetical protein CYMTET_10951 [Cymbomonas tetramitiformis]|uniref:Uncharacterized protein n=1 Tax=Cymbomonas tetramitiformis TaxID=36881 RepID=A0AAE0GN96_9CHLO|nr:hypothetical protein CYMTET_10951 [Cymbomonas tetramitiformis]
MPQLANKRGAQRKQHMKSNPAQPLQLFFYGAAAFIGLAILLRRRLRADTAESGDSEEDVEEDSGDDTAEDNIDDLQTEPYLQLQPVSAVETGCTQDVPKVSPTSVQGRLALLKGQLADQPGFSLPHGRMGTPPALLPSRSSHHVVPGPLEEPPVILIKRPLPPKRRLPSRGHLKRLWNLITPGSAV